MRAGLVIMLCLALSACGESGHDELRQWMVDSSKDLRGRIPPLPKAKDYEPVPYDAGGLIDPFRPSKLGLEQKKGGGGRQPDVDRAREPLESFPLESLKYVGVLMRKSTAFAIIQADASLYQVRTGNYMGQNFGVVTRVTEEQVLLKELVQDAAGDWVERESTLQLQAQEVKK